MSEKIIEVSGLQKSYKANRVLEDVSFTIDKGSIFALLGSNGAGKTTVIKILSTLLKSDGGSAVINGFDIATNGENVRECISLTGQFVAVDEVLTGRENLMLIGRLKHLPNLKSTVNEWLAFSRLKDAANRKVSTYSGGMRRRLDIAMSLMGNPDVLFLDEPTTGLDPQNRIAMWDLVKDLAKTGTTVFLTTQYLEEAEYLADNIAILHGGKIIAEGTPKYLKEIMPERGVRLIFDSEVKANSAIKLLAQNGISADNVEQNLPSLEDVFLTLIDEKKESNQHEKNEQKCDF
jgi:ABC-2 type transport system ATP-binding protein